MKGREGSSVAGGEQKHNKDDDDDDVVVDDSAILVLQGRDYNINIVLGFNMGFTIFYLFIFGPKCWARFKLAANC